MTRVGDRIIGTWSLHSWTYVSDDKKERVDYLGKDSIGTLTYTKTGDMSVQIMKGGRKKFASGSLMDGTPEEIQSAFTSFFAYFGKYEETEPGVLAHHIQGSNFPNWVAETEIRNASILHDGDLLLSAPGRLPDGKEILFEVRWNRSD